MRNIENILQNCQICNKKLVKLFSLGEHPLCDDLIKINNTKKNNTYPIELIFCKNCLIVYQKYQIKHKILFPSKYHYRGRFTKDVVNGQKSLVNSIEKKYGNLKNKKILDVGCNDGTLLNFFKNKKALTYGIEPTNAFKEANSKHKIVNDFFNYNTAKLIKKKYNDLDYITFTNVFAHINNLDETLKSLKFLMSKKTKIIIENHYLGSVIKKKQIDTFYHEHPRTYSLKSLLNISKKLNLNLEYFEFPQRYGGNIRVFMGKNDTNKNFDNLFKKEESFFKELKETQRKIKNWKSKKTKQINQLNKKYGPLPAKAFPGRAAILIKLLNLNKNNIFASYEKPNSKKIGHYIPGTKIPILNDNKLRKKINKNIPIINLAWHIKDEIKKYLKIQKIHNRIVNIIDKKDFI
jgi:hypothetical protein